MSYADATAFAASLAEQELRTVGLSVTVQEPSGLSVTVPCCGA